MDAAKFSSFLVKVASRCNLNCDYCYVYHHADQSWRSMPKLLSREHREAFSRQLATYITYADLKRASVILHGGEPLLAGAQVLAEFALQLRQSCNVPIDVSLQTNGLLLSREVIEVLSQAEVGISLSLDGPKHANDKHRLTHNGRSSFEQTEAALIRLQDYPSVFAGVIAVIDASVTALELFEYFEQFDIPRLDFLLPDAHWLRPPPGRDQNSELYADWLISAFDVWIDHYAHIPLRFFEALLDGCAGLPSTTDAFGLGDVSLLSVETDGSFHDLDVLKITQDNATKLIGGVMDTPIADIAKSSAIEQHRRYLSKEGLSDACQACSIVNICGGGALPHRFGDNGFVNPTVYCYEMKRLVEHIKKRLAEHTSENEPNVSFKQLPSGFDLEQFELAETSSIHLGWLLTEAQLEAVHNFKEALTLFPENKSALILLSLDDKGLESIGSSPGAIAWSNAVQAKSLGQTLLTVDGKSVLINADYLDMLLTRFNQEKVSGLAVAYDDFWIRAPFGSSIYFEGEQFVTEGRLLVSRAISIIDSWRPALVSEILTACRAVQFVRDPAADPSKIVSFSDNSVPGVLYVSIVQGDRLIDPYDLADSIIHEHRHQKLYLLERCSPMVEPTSSLVVSPWREDLRPPSGLFHAVFVFVELWRFWIYVRDFGPKELNSRAVNQIADTEEHLKQAFSTIAVCPLTELGANLIKILKSAVSDVVK